MNVKTSSGPALDMRGATVTMNLVGTNTLTSTASTSAGVQTTGGTLTIDGTGKLIAQGGLWGAGIGGGSSRDGGIITIKGGTVEATGGLLGAGIGGGNGGDGGNITIEGGTVKATSSSAGAGIGGGSSGGAGGNIAIKGGIVEATSGLMGAGIGGGREGAGGNINIEGGTVVATGGDHGAGIGGGWRGDGGDITIEGGTVVATGGNYGAGIGGGNLGDGADLKISGGLITATGGGTQYDIGGGPDSSAGTTKITGGNLIADPDKIQGGVKDGSGNPAYRVALDLDGGSFDPNTEVAVTVGGSSWNAVTNSEGKLFLYLNTSANGKEISVVTGGRTYSGTLAADGVKVDHTGAITLSDASYVSGRTININDLVEGQYGDKWSFTGGILTIKDGADLEITGTGVATANRIVVESGAIADITLNNVNVSTGFGAALDMRGATVDLTITGTNVLANAVTEYEDPNAGFAGVQTTGGTLTIDGTGKLIAQGGSRAAGIGGGDGGDGGNINIEGGTVEATGGDGGAGIGGGSEGDGGIITVSGDAGVTAQGGRFGSGIGGGDYGDGGTIKIEGGTVEATGGRSGSGIGGGFEGDGGTINISGAADVTAQGGDYGAGIGGGDYGDGGNITIEGGTVEATGGGYGAGIGGGKEGDGGIIKIEGGTVEATGGDYSAGIGGGGGYYDTPSGDGADLTISGGSVTVNDGWIGGGINSHTGVVGADGTTTITGGSLSIADPTANIHGGVTNGADEDSYKVAVSGLTFAPDTLITYSTGGSSQTFKTDPSGKLELYLAVADNDKQIELQYGGKTYVGTLVVNGDHTGSVSLSLFADTTPPTLTPGTAQRTSDETGTVKFTSDEAGEYYYAVVEKGASAPTIDTGVPGIACGTSEQTINLSGLDATKEYDIYILVKDAADNESSMLKIELGLYGTVTPPVPPSPPDPPIIGGGKGLVLQVGPNEGDTLTVYIEGMSAAKLGIDKASIATRKSASAAIGTISGAINTVLTQRAALGALQNRLQYKIANLDNSAENLSAAESRIRDADMAKEMMGLVKRQMIEQAATAMLSQANAAPQSVLELLRSSY